MAGLEPTGDAVEVECVLCNQYISGVTRRLLLSDVLTLQIPHATVHSSDVAEAWLAWQSMHRSMIWLRQMAQLSTTMSHAQSATAFHYAVSVSIASGSCSQFL